jgi:hypothetical protein
MTIDYNYVAGCIPEFINALYNEEALAVTDLKEIRDAFRKKQIEGKASLLNLADQYCQKQDKILVVGSWIGFTSFCLYKMGYSNITETDPDTRLDALTTHANRFNADFKHLSEDVNQLDVSQFNTVINTSCEHILDNTWFDNAPKGTTFFLQSTDYPNWDHVNTCSSIEEMISKYPMELLHSETLQLGNYNRFFLVGRK